MYSFILSLFRLCCAGLNGFVNKFSFFTTGSFLFLIIFFTGMSLSAQCVLDVDKFDGSPLKGQFYNVAGSAVSMAKYIRVVEGSPVFLESWMKGSATYEQTITTSSVFYVLINNTFFSVKKISALIEIFYDKKTELQQFAKKPGLSGKSDSDFIQLVQQYNSHV